VNRVKINAVWDRSTEFISDHLALIFPITLMGILVPAVLQDASGTLSAGAEPGLLLALRAIGLVLSIISLSAQLAIIAAAVSPELTTGQALRRGQSRLLVALGLSALVVVGFVLALLPPVLVLASTGVDFAVLAAASAAGQAAALTKVSSGVAVFVICYGLGLAVLLVWFAARSVLLSPVVVAENRGLASFARSFALTRGLTWRIIGLLILFTVVSTVAGLAAKTVFGSVFRLALGGESAFSLSSLLTSTIVGTVAAGFTVLGAVVTAKLYVAARDAAQEASGIA